MHCILRCPILSTIGGLCWKAAGTWTSVSCSGVTVMHVLFANNANVIDLRRRYIDHSASLIFIYLTDLSIILLMLCGIASHLKSTFASFHFFFWSNCAQFPWLSHCLFLLVKAQHSYSAQLVSSVVFINLGFLRTDLSAIEFSCFISHFSVSFIII